MKKGVLWDRRIIAWDDVDERWDPDHDTLALWGFDQNNNRLRCAVFVPEQRRDAVLALLQEKIPRETPNEQVSAQTTADEQRE